MSNNKIVAGKPIELENTNREVPRLDNLFIIKAINDLMTKENHPKSISIGDSVVFDRSIEPYSGCIALIETKTDYHCLAMLKECCGGFVGVYLNDDYKGIEIPVKSVVAAATQKIMYKKF